MKLYKTTQQNYIDFQLGVDSRQIAVANVTNYVHLPYCDKDANAISGPVQLQLPECKNKEEFISEINKNPLVHVDLINDKFRVTNSSELLGKAPAGIFKAKGIDKKMVLTKETNDEYRLRDFIDLGFTNGNKCIFFRGGSTRSFLGNIHFTGTKTDSRLLQTQSMVAVTDLVTGNRFTTSKTFSGLANSYRCRSLNDVCTLSAGGRYCLPQLNAYDSIVLDVTGINNGMLLQSPFMGFLDPLHLERDDDLLTTCAAGLVFRANRVFENRKMEFVANIPDDVKSIRILN